MNKKLHIDVDETILVKYLAGEASPEEAIAVDLWMEQDKKNRLSFEELQKTWHTAAGSQPPVTPDVEKEWMRWEQNNRKEKTAVRSLFTRIAAACMVLLVIVLGYFFLRSDPAQQMIMEARQETPQQWLPDSTSVTLSQNGRLLYSPDFGTTERLAALEGSAYFNVRRNTSHPFTIQCGALTIQVIGTAFDVIQTHDSIMVQVDEGAVKLITPQDSAVLRAGCSAVYYREDHRLMISGIQKTFSFDFNEKTLKQVAAELEAASGVKIVFENPKLEYCVISTAFRDKTIDYIAEIIAASLGLQYRIEDNVIYLQGNDCR